MAEHIRFEKMLNKTYLGEWDLPEDGSDMIVKIKDVKQEEIQSPTGGKETKTVLYFDGDVKPMIANVTNMKRIAGVAQSSYLDEWIGVKIQLYKEMVPSFGTVSAAIRVREFAPAA